MTEPEIRNWWHRDSVPLACDSEGDMAKQEHKEAADIVRICRLARQEGEWPPQANAGVRTHLKELSELGGLDYSVHLERVAEAEQLFDQLPAELRDLAGNEPSEFYRMLGEDQEDGEELRKALGLQEETEAPAEAGPGPQKPSSGESQESEATSAAAEAVAEGTTPPEGPAK